jgi:uncharacterized membrane protein YbhN (UPF0104 family)
VGDRAIEPADTEETPPQAQEPRLERRRVLVALGGALIGAAALVAVAVVNRGEFEDAIDLLTWQSVLALAALHLIALVFRAFAWNLCLRAAEREAPAPELHSSSSARFLADTVVPTYIGAWVRIGLLRRMLGDRSPTVGQMLLADVVLLLVEGGITIVLAVAVTFTADIDWWWPLIPGGPQALCRPPVRAGARRAQPEPQALDPHRPAHRRPGPAADPLRDRAQRARL